MTLEQRLRTAGTRRKNATGQLYELVREAAQAGWTKTRIAEVGGISRQTVHTILKGDST